MHARSTIGYGRRAALVAALVALAGCAPGPNFAGLQMGPRRSDLQERILVHTLSNGLRVVVLPDKRTNLVNVGVHYAVGGADDPLDGEGLAHYVEHVMFDAGYHGQGGDRLRDVGLEWNAVTTFDRTYFHLTALDAELEFALEIAARRFEADCEDFDAATLARERDVVIEEAKLRSTSTSDSVRTGLFKAIWGAAHPYGRSPGGHGFANLPRPALCKFIQDHYGPGSAVLVVTGNIREDEIERIGRRFGRIAARPAAQRPARTTPIRTSRLVVRELARPTALVVFEAPGEGTAADASVEALDGQLWPLGGGAPAQYARTLVVGGERERAIVAIAEVADAKQLDELASAMVKAFEKPKFDEFEMYKQQARANVAARLDDTFTLGATLAAAVARGERPTRFRDLRQLDDLTEANAMHWLDAPKVRVAFLLPEVDAAGTQKATDIATKLHQLDVPRGAYTGTQPPALPVAHRPLAVTEHRLGNGLRVLLAPDREAFAIDARLVITGTRDGSASGLDAQAASFLKSVAEHPTDSVEEHMRWYQTIAAPVTGIADEQTTTFQIRGFALFGDWHVLHLAWTVVHGRYRDAAIEAARRREERRASAPDRDGRPSAGEVVMRRLAGAVDVPEKVTIHSADALEAFRRARYRPDASTLIVSGKFDVEAMRKEINSLFGEWRAEGSAVAEAAAKAPRVRSSVGIADDDAPTVEIAVAFAAETTAAPSEAAARAVLRAMIDTRLRIVREGMGASYGVYAVRSTRAVGVYGDVEPAYAAQAAKAMADELERIRSGDASLIDDFVQARKRVLASALALPLGASRRADALERVVTRGSAVKQIEQEVETIRTLDFAAVQKIAARDMKPERMIIAVRGKKTAVEGALGAFGIAKEAIEWLALPKGKGGDKRGPEGPPKLTTRTLRGS